MSLHSTEARIVLIYQQIRNRIKMQLLSSFELFISFIPLFFPPHAKMKIFLAWNYGKQMKKNTNPDWYKTCLNNQSNRTDTLTCKIHSSAWRSAHHNRTGRPLQHLSGTQAPYYLLFMQENKVVFRADRVISPLRSSHLQKWNAVYVENRSYGM